MVVLLQGLHVLCGIVWFGGAIFHDFVVAPTLGALGPGHQNAFIAVYGKKAGRLMAPAGGLTILLGVLAGISLGAFGNIGHLWGDTYLLALILGVALLLYSMLVIGRNGEKLARLEPGSEAFAKASQAAGSAAMRELFGFLAIFVLMVALQFGY